MNTRENIPISDDLLAEAAFETFDCVEGEVFEVMGGIGLAHVRTASGQIFGLNRDTRGIDFSKLREGARVRCSVAQKFSRVMSAELLD